MNGDFIEQIIEAWRTNNRINLFLIDNIDEEGMKCTLSKRGGRNVVRQFAHMHNVRLWHLENRAKDLAHGLRKFAAEEEPLKKEIKDNLIESGDKIEIFLADTANGIPKRRGFKKGIITTISYFIAHESHHRGNILLTLKECGHNLPQDVKYAIWDWDGR